MYAYDARFGPTPQSGQRFPCLETDRGLALSTRDREAIDTDLGLVRPLAVPSSAGFALGSTTFTSSNSTCCNVVILIVVH